MSADSKVNFIARVKEMIDEHRLEITGLGAGKIKRDLTNLTFQNSIGNVH